SSGTTSCCPGRVEAMSQRAVLAAILIFASIPRFARAQQETVIDEVMAGVGTGGSSQIQYIEMRIRGASQDQVTGSRFAFFQCPSTHDSDPPVIVMDALPNDLTNAAVGDRWIIATDAFAASAHITPDFLFRYQSSPLSPMTGAHYYDCGM